MKEGTTLNVVTGIFTQDCDHHPEKAYKGINVTYRHYRGNIFKSELGEGDFMSQFCPDCLVEARLRVITKELESNKYTRKYKAELKRLAKAESEWIYDD